MSDMWRMCISVPGKLHPGLNQWQRMHWSKRRREKKAWESEIWAQMLDEGVRVPEVPLCKARVFVVRWHTGQPLDRDNFIVKGILDALVGLGVLQDDKPEVVYALEIDQQRVSTRGEVMTTIEVEGI